MSNDINLKIRVTNAASKPLDEVTDSAKRANTSLGTIEGTIGGLTSSIIKGNVATMAMEKAFAIVAGAAKAFGTALVQGVQNAIEFEKALAGIKTIAGDIDLDATRSELLALSSAFGFDELSTAKAQYDLLSAGITDAADAAVVLKASAELATAGMDSLDSASKTVGTAINAFSLTAKDAAHITDVLAKTTQFGVLTLGELGNAFGSVAPIAAGAGVSLEETSAALAAITLSGKDASASATGLKALLSALLKPSADLEEAFRKVSKESVAMSVQNKGLAETLKLVNAAAGGTSEGWLKLTGGSDAASAGLTLAVAKGKELVKFTNEMKNSTGEAGSAVRKMGEVIKNTAEFQLGAAAQALKNLGIKFGASFEPAVAAAAAAGAKIIGIVGGWVTSNKPALDAAGKTLAKSFEGIGEVITKALNSAEFERFAEAIKAIAGSTAESTERSISIVDKLGLTSVKVFSELIDSFNSLMETLKEFTDRASGLIFVITTGIALIGQQLMQFTTGPLKILTQGVDYLFKLVNTTTDAMLGLTEGVSHLLKQATGFGFFDREELRLKEAANATNEEYRKRLGIQLNLQKLGQMAGFDVDPIIESYKKRTSEEKKYQVQFEKGAETRRKLTDKEIKQLEDLRKKQKEVADFIESQLAEQASNQAERLIDIERNWNGYSEGVTTTAQRTNLELIKLDEAYLASKKQQYDDLVKELERQQEEAIEAIRKEQAEKDEFFKDASKKTADARAKHEKEMHEASLARWNMFFAALNAAWDVSGAKVVTIFQNTIGQMALQLLDFEKLWDTTLQTIETLVGAFTGKLATDIASAFNGIILGARNAVESLRDMTKALAEGSYDPKDIEARKKGIDELTAKEAERNKEALDGIAKEFAARSDAAKKLAENAQRMDFSADLKEQLDNIDAIRDAQIASIKAVEEQKDAQRKKDAAASIKSLEAARAAALEANKSSGLSKYQLDFLGKTDSEVQAPVLAKIKEEFDAKIEAQRELVAQAEKESDKATAAAIEAINKEFTAKADFAKKVSGELSDLDKRTADEALSRELENIERAKQEAIKAAEEVNKVRNESLKKQAELPVDQTELKPTNMIKELAVAAGDYVQQLAKSSRTWFRDLTTGADDLVDALTDGAIVFVETIIEQFADSDFIEAMAKAAEKLINNFSALLPKLVDSLVKLLPRLLEAIIKNLPMLVNSLLTALINMVTTLGPSLIKMISTVIVTLLQRLPEIIDAILELIPMIIAELPRIVQALVEAIPGIIDSLVENLPAIVDALIEAIPQIIGTVIENVPNIIMAIVEALPTIIVQLVKLVASAIVFGVSAAAKGVAVGLKKFGVWIWDGLKEALGKVGDFLKGLGGQIFGGLWNGMKWAWDQLAKFGKRIFNGLWDGIKGVWNSFLDIGKNIFAGFWNALSSAAYGIGDWLAETFSFSNGGVVPGTAKVPGNSKTNDTVRAMLSPGEIVIPRSAVDGGISGAMAFLKDAMGATTQTAMASSVPVQKQGFDLSGIMASIGGQEIVVQIDGREVARAVRGEVQRGFRLA